MFQRKVNKLKLFFILFIVFSCYIFSSNAGQNRIEKPSPHLQTSLSYVFIQTAQKATIKLKKNSANEYELVLEKTSPLITYFSDRPNRVTGVMSLDQFLITWNKGIDSFKIDPPNVTISGDDEKNNNLFFIFELTHPQFDKKTNIMIYDIKFISPHPNFSKKPVQLHNPILFFDDWLPEWCPSCCCG